MVHTIFTVYTREARSTFTCIWFSSCISAVSSVVTRIGITCIIYIHKNSLKIHISLYNNQRCQFESSSWQCVLYTTLYDKVCKWLVTGRWFSPCTQVSSTNKTDRHDITEILLKVSLNTITFPLKGSMQRVACVVEWLTSLTSIKKFSEMYHLSGFARRYPTQVSRFLEIYL